MESRTVGILIFDQVEVLDFCGPFEVFSVTGEGADYKPFQAFTVGERSPVTARNGLSVNPHYLLADAPPIDILLIPGGYGTRTEIENEVLIEWIRQHADSAELILSVCTGALLLAKAGLLEGIAATTHWGAIEELRAMAPGTEVREQTKHVDNGKIVTSAGISAGIEMSLHIVQRLLGVDQALHTSRYMEYDWKPSHR